MGEASVRDSRLQKYLAEVHSSPDLGTVLESALLGKEDFGGRRW